VTFVRYIVSRFAFVELFCGDVEALGDGMQSGTVCIDGGEVDVVVGDVDVVAGDAASLSFEPLPQPARMNARTVSAAIRFKSLSLLSFEAALYLPRGEPIHLDELRSSALPADDLHRALRDVERRSEKADERLVRPPALRRCRHAHLPAVAVPPDELRPSRARRDGDANPSP
jgi:hypothetical protein